MKDTNELNKRLINLELGFKQKYARPRDIQIAKKLDETVYKGLTLSITPGCHESVVKASILMSQGYKISYVHRFGKIFVRKIGRLSV
jgi:hypothetical protein